MRTYPHEEIMEMENRLHLLTRKLNSLKEAYIIKTDAGQKFEIEYDIDKTEKAIQELKNGLQSAYNLKSPAGESLLKDKIRQLSLTEPAGDLYRVNCNRQEAITRFWNTYDQWNRQSRFQFYFISACPTQMPQSFSERAIYELIIQELEEEFGAIKTPKRADSNRVKPFELPLGRNLEKSKDAFKKFFAQQFEFSDATSFEGYLETGLPKLGFEYAALVFWHNERQWSDFIPEYYQWILDTFTGNHEDLPHFLFFFVHYVEGLHLPEILDANKKTIVAALKTLADGHPASLHLSPLYPVPVADLRDWIMHLGETNPARIDLVLEALEKGLKDADLKQYKEKKLLNMDDIELLQTLVLDVINEDGRM